MSVTRPITTDIEAATVPKETSNLQYSYIDLHTHYVFNRQLYFLEVYYNEGKITIEPK